jgi:hypothetical protein
MRGQPNVQRQNAVNGGDMMPEFPIYGPSIGMGIYGRYPAQSLPINRNPSDIPLNNPPEAYGAYCDPEIRMITEACIEQFPYLSNSGQYQYGTSYEVPIGANVSWQQQRRPFPFYEWGAMGLYQVQYPDTQYADTKSPLGIQNVYGPSFGEWVTGPWLLAITQEVYQQYNSPLPNPWGDQR